MKTPITVAYGAGIGPEIMTATLRILDAAGAQLELERIEIGETVYKKGLSNGIEPASWDSLHRTKVFLKAPITTPQGGGFKSLNVTVRKTLAMYANVRPCASLYPYVATKHPRMDIVIVRENTEDLYAGLEHTVVPGVVESLKIITERASTRVARFAFEYARKFGRKKISAVHKANIMKLSDGLFLTSVRKVAAEYPAIEYKEIIVDNACMQMVLKPNQFDVLLLTNLYGDIMSDLAAGLVGGLGVVPSGNIGETVAVFEAVHGTAPDIAGKNIANPTALLMSSIMMLRHIDEIQAAKRAEDALFKVYREGKSLTRDVGGTASTTEFTDNLISTMGK